MNRISKFIMKYAKKRNSRRRFRRRSRAINSKIRVIDPLNLNLQLKQRSDPKLSSPLNKPEFRGKEGEVELP